MQNELKKGKKLHGGRFFARKGTFLGHDLSGIYARKKQMHLSSIKDTVVQPIHDNAAASAIYAEEKKDNF